MDNQKTNNDLPNSTDDNKIDELLFLTLKQNGYFFPSSDEEFKQMEKEIEMNPLEIPKKLLDPIGIIENSTDTGVDSNLQSKDYITNLAQAAREGGVINEDAKKKMAADKINAKKRKR